jgi:hypothetical protein
LYVYAGAVRSVVSLSITCMTWGLASLRFTEKMAEQKIGIGAAVARRRVAVNSRFQEHLNEAERAPCVVDRRRRLGPPA